MRPKVLLDPHWRRMEELFAPDVLADLKQFCDLTWARDAPMPETDRRAALAQAQVLIATMPQVTRAVLEEAPALKLVIETEGAFPDTIDYEACAERGIEVLSCAPGFRQAVAEMGLAMALSGARGLVAEHEAMRQGQGGWLEDQVDRDFTLYGSDIGFVGFGQIAQELTRLLAPFRPRIRAYDPWLPKGVAREHGVDLVSLDEVMALSQTLFVAAAPTTENRHMLGAARLALMPRGAHLVLLSRAHLVDFEALSEAVAGERIKASVDVYPEEPMAASDPFRKLPGLILSPHRAAAVAGGRQLIGEMIRDDLRAWRDGSPTRRLTRADPDKITALAGLGDASQTGQMAVKRS